MARLTLTATVKVRKGMEERGRRELSWLVPRSRKDKGCLRYELHQGVEDKAVFMFFERWEDKAALDAHTAQPFMKEFDERNADLFLGAGEVMLWEEASPSA